MAKSEGNIAEEGDTRLRGLMSLFIEREVHPRVIASVLVRCSSPPLRATATLTNQALSLRAALRHERLVEGHGSATRLGAAYSALLLLCSAAAVCVVQLGPDARI